MNKEFNIFIEIIYFEDEVSLDTSGLFGQTKYGDNEFDFDDLFNN